MTNLSVRDILYKSRHVDHVDLAVRPRNFIIIAKHEKKFRLSLQQTKVNWHDAHKELIL